jgi:hypothetical protein
MSAVLRLLFLLPFLVAAPVRAIEPAPPLGRLFMTPDARAALERQRQLNLREARSIEGGSIRLDGIVVRSSGKTTVWVNNQPQTENALDTGVAVTTSPRRPDRATLATGAGAEPPAELRVGASIDRATRETSDGLADGVIHVNPPGRK